MIRPLFLFTMFATVTKMLVLQKVLSFSLLIFCCGCVDSFAPNDSDSRVDSLDYFIYSADLDSLPNSIRKKFADKALKILSVEENDSINRLNYLKVANRFYNIQEYEDYKKTTETAIFRAESKNDTISMAKGLSYMGDYYARKYLSDSAFTYYVAAEKLYRIKREHDKLAQTLLQKAVLQHNENDYIGAEKSAYEALKLLRQSGNTGLHYDALNLLGLIHTRLSEYDTALLYHQKALKLTTLPHFEESAFYKSSTLNNIGVVYQNIKEFKLASNYFSQSLEFKGLYNYSPNNYIYTTLNHGYSNLKLNQLTEMPQIFMKVMKISDSLNIVSGRVLSRLHLGRYFHQVRDTMSAITYTKDAYNIARRFDQPKEVLLSLSQLSEIDPTKAGDYSGEYIKISDSLQIAERQIRNKLGRIEYETEELAIEKEQLVESRKQIIYVALGVILLGVLAYVIRFQAAKNRELRLVRDQQKANEEIYQLMLNQQNKVEEVRQAEKKRIAQELHDGVLGKLFGTRMNLGVLNSKTDDHGIDARAKYIDELQSLENEIREISHDLNSEKAAVFNNFVVMVVNFITSQRSVCKAEIQLEFDSTIDWNAVDNIVKINFYRILQEAFQNINKHSNAGSVQVLFHKEGNLARLHIKDDGKGFVFSRKRNGIGLQNMLSRIVSSGGSMNVDTGAGNGTHLKFEVPI